jgi:cobalt-zinc-cadmium efflux system outer membrane protein
MKSTTIEIALLPIPLSRWWVVSVLLLAAAAWPARALSKDYSEADVIRLAQAQDPDLLAARQAVAVAKAQRLEAGLYPNPSVGWDREHFPGGASASESEDAVFVSIPIDLSPRRSTLEHLAQSDVAVAGAEAALTQTGVVVRALTHFYHLLAERQRGRIEQRAAERLKEAARVVKRRKQEGKASGYDLARIEVEAALVASTHRRTQARSAGIQAELQSLLGIKEGPVSFSGSLDPDGRIVSSKEPNNESDRPSLRLLRAAASSAGDAGTAAKRTWIPILQISGGPRIGRADKTRYGYAAGVSVEIPLFSRGQELRARAEARQRYAQARADAAQRSAQIERERAQRVLRAAQREIKQLDESTRNHVDALERAAESGYREGERSIVEFLDARRIRSTIEVRRLELTRSLKQAEVALRAARGDFE